MSCVYLYFEGTYVVLTGITILALQKRPPIELFMIVSFDVVISLAFFSFCKISMLAKYTNFVEHFIVHKKHSAFFFFEEKRAPKLGRIMKSKKKWFFYKEILNCLTSEA